MSKVFIVTKLLVDYEIDRWQQKDQKPKDKVKYLSKSKTEVLKKLNGPGKL